MGSRDSFPWRVFGVVSLMVILSGCGGTPFPADNGVEVSNQVDRDCDGASRSVTINMSVVLGLEQPADGETNVLIIAKTGVDKENQIHQFKSVSGWEINERLKLSASELGNPDSSVTVVVKAVRPGIFQTQLISSGSTNTFEVESAGEDSSSLSASFKIGDSSPNRSEETQLTANSVESQCDIVSYSWDIDGDGEFERSGGQITVSYQSDGHHEITLRVEDSAGVTQETTKELLVFHDPDRDGITTAYEQDAGTDPYKYDTDNDLLNDRIDPMPRSAILPLGIIQMLLTLGIYIVGFVYLDLFRELVNRL